MFIWCLKVCESVYVCVCVCVTFKKWVCMSFRVGCRSVRGVVEVCWGGADPVFAWPKKRRKEKEEKEKVCIDFSEPRQTINPSDYSVLSCLTGPLQSDVPANNEPLMNQTSMALVSPSCLFPMLLGSLSNLVWWEKLLTLSAPIDKQFGNEE